MSAPESTASAPTSATVSASPVGERRWWQDAVVYQVYLRSFADANGDGIGDLDGVLSRLDHLSWLGVDAIWLNPCYPSPQLDHGYDVADYFDIHPEYGTIETFDTLVAEARRRGIRILMDLVPNHCSSEHPWFTAARAAAPGSRERARFWVRDGRPDDHGDPHGAPPNNWRAAFGGSAWTRLGPDDPQWYLGTFTPHQPDLNHTDPDVEQMFRDVLDFWFDRGVEGFRVDAIAPVGKHPDLPDQPPYDPGLSEVQITWENPHTVWRPEGHDVWRSMRATIDEYMDRHPGRDLVMVAEAYLNGNPELLAEFARPDQFHQVFNFDLMKAAWNPGAIWFAIDEVLGLAGRGITPCWTLNNHDIQRVVTRLGRLDAHEAQTMSGNSLVRSEADVDEELGRRRARALIALVMALPGSVYIYQGEELGLPEVLDIPADRREDPVFLRTEGREPGRDGCRIPLPWNRDPATAYGFSSRPDDGGEPAEPWLPQPDGWGDHAATGDDGADGAGGSDGSGQRMIELYRTLIEARRELLRPELRPASIVDLGDGLIAVRHGDLVVVLNTTPDPIALDLEHPELSIARPVVASEPGEMHTPGVIPPDATIWFTT